MTTTTIPARAHGHVTVRRTGRTVTLEASGKGILASQKCADVAAAKACATATIKTWRALWLAC